MTNEIIKIPYKKKTMVFPKKEWEALKEEFEELMIGWSDTEKKKAMLDILLFNK